MVTGNGPSKTSMSDPQNLEHVKLHGRGEIWLQMKLRLLIADIEMGGYPGLY